MPIKIMWTHKWEGPKRGKIDGIQILHGYYCITCCWCDKGSVCKYRKGSVFHNFSVTLHRFFEYKLHIKLPHWLYINKESIDLSGADLCPFHKSQRYTCWDCKHSRGDHSCEFNYSERKHLDPESDPDWHGRGRCGSFDPQPWCFDWDRHTGKRI